jgi:class 3 adenylate cyclase
VAFEGLVAMNDVRAWLRSLKLEQYADAFAANDIDFDILGELTEGDLERLGMSLGNRRRLMRAIAERGSAPGPAADPVPPEPPADAERRQVTVLFCDLVGSTELSQAIDPEILSPLLRAYQDNVAGTIGRFGGFVAKFMGDGVLAYFGFPRAHEDAAERAVHAALAVRAQVGQLQTPDGRRLQSHIGIATGLVVVGEIIGDGAAQERAIVGETPNLAARLQALALPDTILISDATRQLLGNLFDLDEMGAQELKGISRPVPVWRVRAEATVESRFAATRAGSSLPFLGRAHEMGLLMERWDRARLGEGEIVTVIGEAGIGKSRIIEAVQDALHGAPHTRVHLQCSPYHSDTAFYPVIQHLTRAAGMVAGDPPASKMAKLKTLFPEPAAPDAAAILLLAELLSIPFPDPTPTGSLAPAQRKAAIIALLVDELVRLGTAEPALLVLEDAHWIDASTLELMTRLADEIGEARLLALVTARSEFTPPWLARPHVTLLTLGRLSRGDCAKLVTDIAASQALPRETVEAIIAKTDGVPLFLEEMTKSVLEVAEPDAAMVPATLKDSLMARLDRLGTAREIAQVAAVIGRQFPRALLGAVMPLGAIDLDAGLERLIAAGIVFPQGRGPERNYGFKHALLRDAAYESLLLARRREWHERIAHALEHDFQETGASEPEILARHFGEAGLAAEAADYRERAGDRAASRSAYREAVAHYSAGLKEAERLSDETTRRRRQLALLLKLAPALTITTSAQSEEVASTCRRAAEIAEALEDDAAAFKAKWGVWLNANLARKTAVARDQANALVALAERSGDGDLLLEAYHCGWSTAFFRGDIATSQRLSGIGIATYDMARHRHLGTAFGGHDPGVCAQMIVGLTATLAEDAARAARHCDLAVALGEALDHPFSLVHAAYNAAMMYQIAGDRAHTAEMAERAMGMAEKYGFPSYHAGAVVLLAWTRGPTVRETSALDQEIERAATGPNVQYLLGLAGEILLRAGRPGDAASLLDRALAANEERDVGYYLAEIWRLKGACALALDRGDTDKARAAYLSARQVATQQGAILFARRAEDALAEIGIAP